MQSHALASVCMLKKTKKKLPAISLFGAHTIKLVTVYDIGMDSTVHAALVPYLGKVTQISRTGQ